MANDIDDACLRAVRAHSCDEVRKLCTLGVAGTQLVPIIFLESPIQHGMMRSRRTPNPNATLHRVKYENARC